MYMDAKVARGVQIKISLYNILAHVMY